MDKVCLIAAVAGCVGVASAQIDVYSSDFEGTPGGWTASGSGSFEGDWEYEANYDASNYTGDYTPPATANSGTGMWGTVMYNDYQNSGESSYLRQTFDFSGLTAVTLEFASWSNVFTNFDYNHISVNGVLVASSRDTDPVYQLTNQSSGSIPAEWVIESIDLSAFDGMSSVEIEFELSASTVVDRAGWYIDDVTISAIPAPGAAGLLALAGVGALRRRR